LFNSLIDDEFMDSCKCGDDFENPMSFEVDEEDESFV
jgi:hypothetical protein